MTQNREPWWQEAQCYYNNNGGICLAKCEAACMCQNGHLELELRFQFNELQRLREIEEERKQ